MSFIRIKKNITAQNNASTQKIINDVIGDCRYLETISLVRGSGSRMQFLQMTPIEKRDMLMSMLNINVLLDIFNEKKSSISANKTLIKKLGSSMPDFPRNLDQMKQEFDAATHNYNQTKKHCDKLMIQCPTGLRSVAAIKSDLDKIKLQNIEAEEMTLQDISILKFKLNKLGNPVIHEIPKPANIIPIEQARRMFFHLNPLVSDLKQKAKKLIPNAEYPESISSLQLNNLIEEYRQISHLSSTSATRFVRSIS